MVIQLNVRVLKQSGRVVVVFDLLSVDTFFELPPQPQSITPVASLYFKTWLYLSTSTNHFVAVKEEVDL